MTIQDTFDGARFVSATTTIARQRGIGLQVGADFAHYAALIARHREEQPLGPPFDCTRHDIKQANGFWVIGRTPDGEIVHTQAMRLIDLGGLSLADYLQSQFRDFPPSGVDLDLARSRYRSGPGARRISGLVCYHGDVWLKGGDAGYRGTGLSSVLARFALATCLLRWSPDHVFAFMPRAIAFKGLAEREGYMHTEPGCLHWRHADREETLEGYMVWMYREDISHVLTIPLGPLLS